MSVKSQNKNLHLFKAKNTVIAIYKIKDEKKLLDELWREKCVLSAILDAWSVMTVCELPTIALNITLNNAYNNIAYCHINHYYFDSHIFCITQHSILCQGTASLTSLVI